MFQPKPKNIRQARTALWGIFDALCVGRDVEFRFACLPMLPVIFDTLAHSYIGRRASGLSEREAVARAVQLNEKGLAGSKETARKRGLGEDCPAVILLQEICDHTPTILGLLEGSKKSN